MSILDQIATIGTAGRPGPIAAFLVGREQKRQVERQQNRDAQLTENAESLNALRDAQTEALKAPRQPKISAKQFREGEEFVTRKLIDGVPDMSDGGVLARSKIANSAPQVNVNAFDPEARNRETKAARDKIRKENELTDALLDEVSIAIGRNRSVPGAAGLRGAGAELVEGTLGQVPGIGPGASAAAEKMTGVDAKEISQIRTQGRLLVARLVPVVTGDTSGRYTEQEQARTREVESQLQAMKTTDQIEGALSEVQAITLRGQVRKRKMEFINKVAGQELNLQTDEGINTWGNMLVEKYNLSEEDARTELRRHLIMVEAL